MTDSCCQVLLAEDEVSMRELLALNFEAAGLDVVTACDGVEALELVRALHPRVVVLDLMMPGLDGLSVLQAIRAQPETRDIPVLILSAKVTDEDIWAGWQAGADSYLPKPCSIGDLLGAINAALARAA